MNVCIVTGASSGMGRESAKQIDNIYTNGIDEIWLIARSTGKLKEVAASLNHKARIMPLDLSDEKDLAEFELSLELLKPNIKLLVNAAGYGIIGPFKDGDIYDEAGMVRVNCEALTYITHLCLQYMKKGARIIQYSSAAAFSPQANFSVYAASKSFVLSFSRSLNKELKNNGITVTAVCPGPVDTDFFNVAEKYQKRNPFKMRFMAKSEAVVSKALYDSYKRKNISIYSLPMQLLYIVSKIIPSKIMMLFN